MSLVLLIARREWMELRRQPVMLAVVTSLFVVIAGFVVAAVGLLELIALDPATVQKFEAWFPAIGLGELHIADLAQSVVALGNFLQFTQFLGIASVLAGHTILHDRQCHTLPFLLLAPVTRTRVLLGKVLGAVGIPALIYIVVAVVSMGTVSLFPIASSQAAVLPTAASWWIAVTIGAPVWAVGVGVICATVSALARDVRTAQQVVWFVMFFATFAAGYLLAGLMADGVVTELVVAGMGVMLTAGALAVGAQVISRDLSR